MAETETIKKEPKKEPKKEKDYIIIHSYPETIFFYPSMIFAFILSILIWVTQDIFLLPISPEILNALGTLFFAVFAFNFIIIAFDFGLGKTAIISLLVILAIIIFFALRVVFESIRQLTAIIQIPAISASAQFYFCFAVLIFIHLIKNRIKGCRGWTD